MRFEDELQGAPRLRHGVVVERPLAVDRRKSRRGEKGVALAQRHIQGLGKALHHLPAGPCPARLDKAQMARRCVRIVRQIDLAQATQAAPLLQDAAHWAGGRIGGGTGCGTGH